MSDSVISFSDSDRFEWKNVNYFVTNRKTNEQKHILKDVCGSAQCGEVVAILGSSGAGKSTLLNLLAGRISTGTVSGDVYFNGRRRPENWVKLVGYVEQDDLINGFMTVQEAIRFSAFLRLPREFNDAHVENVVADTIHFLGLKECRNNFIGTALQKGISGGQKKRASIGVEMVTDPQILFLDEPTTGLDAFTAQSLILSIKEIAHKQRKIVLLSIHQPRPDVLHMFDKILLLTQGHTVYYGDSAGAMQYFAQLGHPCPNLVNPADFFIDLITVDDRTQTQEDVTQERVSFLIQQWNHVMQTSFAAQASESVSTSLEGDDQASASHRYTIKTAAKRGAWTQLRFLLHRDFRGLVRDRIGVVAIVGQSLFLIFLCCAVFFHIKRDESGALNFIGFLFILPTNFMFATVMPIITMLPMQREMILRERYVSTYRLSLAYFSKALTLLPLRMVMAVLTTLICYYIIYLNPAFDKLLMFGALLLCEVYACVAIGLSIGAYVRIPFIAQVVGPIVQVVFVFFGGNVADTNSISWIFRWIKYTSIIYWMFRGLMISQLTGLNFGSQTGESIIAKYGLDDGLGAWFSILMLLLVGTLAYALGAIGITFRYRPKTLVV